MNVEFEVFKSYEYIIDKNVRGEIVLLYKTIFRVFYILLILISLIFDIKMHNPTITIELLNSEYYSSNTFKVLFILITF